MNYSFTVFNNNTTTWMTKSYITHMVCYDCVSCLHFGRTLRFSLMHVSFFGGTQNVIVILCGECRPPLKLFFNSWYDSASRPTGRPRLPPPLSVRAQCWKAPSCCRSRVLQKAHLLLVLLTSSPVLISWASTQPWAVLDFLYCSISSALVTFSAGHQKFLIQAADGGASACSSVWGEENPGCGWYISKSTISFSKHI